MKKCTKCKELLPNEQFHKSVRGQCKKCFSKYIGMKYLYKKVRAIKYKGKICAHCGKEYHPSLCEFHHVDPNQKEETWYKMRSWPDTKIATELNKCLLLCANCHREVHYKENKFPNFDEVGKLGDPYLFNEKVIYQKTLPVAPTCINCGKNVSKKGKRCISCNAKYQEKINWPSDEVLLLMLSESNFFALGRKLGVTDNAIRHRLRSRGLL